MSRRRRGAGMLCGAALAGGVVWWGVAEPAIGLLARLPPSAAEEQRRLHRQLAADEVVEELLAALAEDVGADRALVFLAHNGSSDLTGTIPFMFVSAAYVHLRAGLSWDERWSRPSPLAAVSPLLRRMFRNPERPVCVKRDRGDADISVVARARMIDRGIEVSFLCPMHGPAGVVGLVTAEVLRRDAPRPLPDAEVMARVAETGRRVREALAAVARH